MEHRLTRTYDIHYEKQSAGCVHDKYSGTYRVQLIGAQKWKTFVPFLPLAIASPLIAETAKGRCLAEDIVVTLPDFDSAIVDLFANFVLGNDVTGDHEQLEPLCALLDTMGMRLQAKNFHERELQDENESASEHTTSDVCHPQSDIQPDKQLLKLPSHVDQQKTDFSEISLSRPGNCTAVTTTQTAKSNNAVKRIGLTVPPNRLKKWKRISLKTAPSQNKHNTQSRTTHSVLLLSKDQKNTSSPQLTLTDGDQIRLLNQQTTPNLLPVLHTSQYSSVPSQVTAHQSQQSAPTSLTQHHLASSAVTSLPNQVAGTHLVPYDNQQAASSQVFVAQNPYSYLPHAIPHPLHNNLTAQGCIQLPGSQSAATSDLHASLPPSQNHYSSQNYAIPAGQCTSLPSQVMFTPNQYMPLTNQVYPSLNNCTSVLVQQQNRYLAVQNSALMPPNQIVAMPFHLLSSQNASISVLPNGQMVDANKHAVQLSELPDDVNQSKS